MNQKNFGKAYLYYGGPSLDSIPDMTFAGEARGDMFGDPVAVGILDINGDIFDDLIVTAHQNDAG